MININDLHYNYYPISLVSTENIDFFENNRKQDSKQGYIIFGKFSI